ncbi:DUF368 domain-containing protein [Corynebacterium sp. 320]|uniref:DUF368 domain-containing protein n=1 Tax=Corynebacterium TaxID=1716 RepID=UPI00125CD34A|nr:MULTISPECIES: DUF368 domain-containing protein [Corynebacterium]KAB1502559.1 DUF368 domain-containing protein [Corynebacterium sp. 320]KAB1551952.1 DUF368 domain-containing protein [Corynebacterium sp. 319]KAB3526166.1 DUF368 domain-containing protein [Corynebacterium sp. 250]KAB3538946.1 DUF368 domain-containing protein [Corynebacterium sp. 366]QNP92900.1 DUF368 domain-containing protein [Corynebacterium zhongnanshanii]
MSILLNIIRGALIGMAELVPGVSGGTIALVTGVYERVLAQANLVLDGLKLLVKDRSAAIQKLKSADWLFLISLLVGMAAVVVSMAGVMEAFVTDQPVASRALFFGMVLVSLVVPLSMINKEAVSRKLPVAIVAFILAAVATFLLTGVTSAPQSNPSLIVVFFAAAVAICALVLPGVSGSFFLLAVGLYSATMGAVHERDLVYIGVFALGALTGIIAFVRILEKLLEDHRDITLVVMAGLMLGSLRALWPWQDESANLEAPSQDIGLAITLFLAGAVAVAIMVGLERAFSAKKSTDDADASTSPTLEG